MKTKPCLQLFGAVCWCLAHQGQALADPLEQIALDVQSPPSCASDEDRVRSEAALLLDSTSQYEGMTITLVVSEVGTAYRVHLTARSPTREAERIVDVDDCDKVVQTLALLVALSVDPDVAGGAIEPTPSPEVVPPQAVPDVSQPPLSPPVPEVSPSSPTASKPPPVVTPGLETTDEDQGASGQHAGGPSFGLGLAVRACRMWVAQRSRAAPERRWPGRASQFCSDDQCGECRTDSDCASAQAPHCDEDKCVECVSDSQCTSEEDCDDGTCR